MSERYPDFDLRLSYIKLVGDTYIRLAWIAHLRMTVCHVDPEHVDHCRRWGIV